MIAEDPDPIGRAGVGRHRPHRHAARHEQPGAASAGKDETRPACRRSLRLMSVSVARIPKNRCRTTAAEPIGGNASGTALYRRPSDRDRIVTTGPSRFQPASPEVGFRMLVMSRIRHAAIVP